MSGRISVWDLVSSAMNPHWAIIGRRAFEAGILLSRAIGTNTGRGLFVCGGQHPLKLQAADIWLPGESVDLRPMSQDHMEIAATVQSRMMGIARRLETSDSALIPHLDQALTTYGTQCPQGSYHQAKVLNIIIKREGGDTARLMAFREACRAWSVRIAHEITHAERWELSVLVERQEQLAAFTATGALVQLSSVHKAIEREVLASQLRQAYPKANEAVLDETIDHAIEEREWEIAFKYAKTAGSNTDSKDLLTLIQEDSVLEGVYRSYIECYSGPLKIPECRAGSNMGFSMKDCSRHRVDAVLGFCWDSTRSYASDGSQTVVAFDHATLASGGLQSPHLESMLREGRKYGLSCLGLFEDPGVSTLTGLMDTGLVGNVIMDHGSDWTIQTNGRTVRCDHWYHDNELIDAVASMKG